MKPIVRKLLQNKAKTLPILSFPAVSLLGITVSDLLSSSERLCEGMVAIARTYPVAAAQSMMDLSVEAEAFGARLRCPENEIPAVASGIIGAIDEAPDIEVPPVGAGRTGRVIRAIRMARPLLNDMPLFAGVIGPYSLAGRLYDMSELMMDCYDSPDEVKVLLEKVTAFLSQYVRALKEAGADGIILAEPAAGLLSPALADEFSTAYVQRIFDDNADDGFVLCYHNCGSSASVMGSRLSTLNADIIHLGNAVDIPKLLAELPADKLVMGGVDPVLLRFGTPEEVSAEVERVRRACASFPNFMISTGCDVPAAAKPENLKAYFDTVTELYS